MQSYPSTLYHQELFEPLQNCTHIRIRIISLWSCPSLNMRLQALTVWLYVSFWGSGPVKRKTELTIAHIQSFREYMGILTLPETNIAPEHIPSQKKQYSYHPFSGAVSAETLASSEFDCWSHLLHTLITQSLESLVNQVIKVHQGSKWLKHIKRIRELWHSWNQVYDHEGPLQRFCLFDLFACCLTNLSSLKCFCSCLCVNVLQGNVKQLLQLFHSPASSCQSTHGYRMWLHTQTSTCEFFLTPKITSSVDHLPTRRMENSLGKYVLHNTYIQGGPSHQL